MEDKLDGRLVQDRYEVKSLLGNGSFGVIHEGFDRITRQPVALKFENSSGRHLQLSNERNVFKKMDQTVGFPKMVAFDSLGKYNVLVMTKLGPSLEDLFDGCKRKFTLKTVCQIGIQMMERLQAMHEQGILHRDVKPDNFLVNLQNPSLIYIIDFGLAKTFMSSSGHILYREDKSLTGTARYASIATHIGLEQSRRDDLEAMIYVLLYFLRGRLPWQGLQASNKAEKYEKIKNCKILHQTNSLCAGQPIQFTLMVDYIRSLEFTETPDYRKLINLFQDIGHDMGFTFNGVMDWQLVQN